MSNNMGSEDEKKKYFDAHDQNIIKIQTSHPNK